MKRFDRLAFVFLLLLTTCTGVLGIYGIVKGWTVSSKWLGSSGLLATVSGVFQLEVSGLFKRIIEQFGDADKYPFGPPSHITREIIDNPDKPLVTKICNMFFFNARTGFWLIIFGTLIQIIAVWL